MDYKREIDDGAVLQYITIYVLWCIGHPIGYDTLVNIITDGCNINFLEFQMSLSNLTDNGFVNFFLDERNRPMYEPTEKAVTAAPLFEKDIPVYIRNPIKAAIKTRLADEFAKNRVRTEIIPVKLDEYAVRCGVYDIDDTRLMELEFYAGDRSAAAEIAERFKNNPDVVYEKVMHALTDEPA